MSMDRPPTDQELHASPIKAPVEEDEEGTLLRQFEAHLLGLAACVKKFRKRRGNTSGEAPTKK